MSRRPIIGRWSQNIGYLLAHQVAEGGGTWASCSGCGTWKPVDPAGLIIEKGPLLSLWNRRPPCRQCGRSISFHAQHAPGARVIPLLTDDPHQTDDLHRAYDRERRRERGE
jgi:hypothetical protein